MKLEMHQKRSSISTQHSYTVIHYSSTPQRTKEEHKRRDQQQNKVLLLLQSTKKEQQDQVVHKYSSSPWENIERTMKEQFRTPQEKKKEHW